MNLKIENFSQKSHQFNVRQNSNNSSLPATQTIQSDYKLMNGKFNNALISRNKVSFKSFENIPKLFSSGDYTSVINKIAIGLNHLKTNEMLVLGNSLQSAQKGLIESIDGINQLIKKVHFIKEDLVKSPFGFIKKDTNQTEIINLSDFYTSITDFTHKDNILNKAEKAIIKPEVDFIQSEELFVPIREYHKVLEQIKTKPEIQIQTFDFSIQVAQKTKGINQKLFQKLYDTCMSKDTKYITFKNVGGQDEVIKELKQSVIFPIKYPEAFRNTTLNKGILLHGQPGTGKTLIAQALANECNANFIKINGLEMSDKFVGETEKNWRKLFDEARQKQPSIIFIDEFDGVAKFRSGSEVSTFADKEVNQLLTLLSDLEKSDDDVFIIAATNKKDLLDDAIIRSGRFGKHIHMALPDTKGCKQILDIHCENLNVSRSFKREDFAQKLSNLKVSGADIAYIAEEAHNNAKLRAKIFEKMDKGTFDISDIENLKIKSEDFEKALDKFLSQNNTNKDSMGFIK